MNLEKFFAKVVLAVVLLTSQACVKDHQIGADEKTITSFGFLKENNPHLPYNVPVTFRGDTLYAHIFAGTEIRELISDFAYDGMEVSVDGILQLSGSSVQDFTEPVDYTVKANDGSTHRYTVKVQDLGIPAIYINADGPILNKEDYVDAQMRIVRGFGEEALYEGDLEIRGRGNSTWQMPKKPFRVKLVQAAPLLDMPSNRHWALIANYADKSLLRNDVAFELSRRFEMGYTPRQQYADVFLDGEYLGNYTLTEHIRHGSNRVHIDTNNGGYILEADGYAHEEPVYFVTPQGMPITVKYPDDDEISAGEIQYITDHYTAFEDALFSEDFSDPEIGYQQYFDLPSFVNYYLVNEISGNPDMFWSMRMYKKSASDPLIYTGPVWDFDLAFNNDMRIGDAVRKLMLHEAHAPRLWIERIAQDPHFKQAVRARWNELIETDLLDINAYVEQQASLIAHSQQFNFTRWSILNTVGIHLNWFVTPTHQGYVNFIKDYLDTRISWLDEVLNGELFD